MHVNKAFVSVIVISSFKNDYKTKFHQVKRSSSVKQEALRLVFKKFLLPFFFSINIYKICLESFLQMATFTLWDLTNVLEQRQLCEELIER